MLLGEGVLSQFMALCVHLASLSAVRCVCVCVCLSSPSTADGGLIRVHSCSSFALDLPALIGNILTTVVRVYDLGWKFLLLSSLSLLSLINLYFHSHLDLVTTHCDNP